MTADVVPLHAPERNVELLERVRALLAEATTVDEVKDLRDRAEALRVYAKQAGLGLEAQNRAAEVKVRCERRGGEFILDIERDPGGRPEANSSQAETSLQRALREAELPRPTAHRWQRLASIPEVDFEEAVVNTVYSGRELTTASLLQLARVIVGSAVGGDLDLPALPEGTFRTIVADPPWQYGNGSTRNAARKHYRTMTIEEVCALGPEVKERSASEAHLYLWTTNSFLREAFEVLEAWGYDYKTCLTWVKPQMGMGNYFRSATEHVLFGVRGGMRTQSRSLVNWFNAARGRHSAKPEHFYSLVEAASPGPYLEMFSRARRLGWQGWGHEA